MTEFESPLSELWNHIKGSEAGSLLNRSEELRTCLIKITIAISLIFFVCFFFIQKIFIYLKEPLILALPEGKPALYFTGPMEVLMSYMRVSFAFAAVIAAPYVFYQLWKFIGPSLPLHSRKLIVPFAISSMVLFTLGIFFCYFMMMPTTLRFLIGMGDGTAKALITVHEYIGLITFMLLAFGAAFQLPLILIILERLGIITDQFLAKNRGGIFVVILITAAIATPSPDPISQISMAAPMYLLFEAAIIIIRRMKRSASVPVKVN